MAPDRSIGNCRTNKNGNGLWLVRDLQDGRWVFGDGFLSTIYLIDRHTKEMILLSGEHKAIAASHPYTTMSPAGTKVQVQSAMLSADNKLMNLCIISVPDEWLKRTYK